MVLKMVKLDRNGVRRRSLTNSNLKVREVFRLEVRLMTSGISLGARPIVPNRPCDRSWVIDPTRSVGTAILNELFRLGSSETTRALETGRSTGPSENQGWPKA